MTADQTREHDPGTARNSSEVKPRAPETGNLGNFGTAQEVIADNEATQNAAEGLTPESLTEGPAAQSANPETAQGSPG